MYQMVSSPFKGRIFSLYNAKIKLLRKNKVYVPASIHAIRGNFV